MAKSREGNPGLEGIRQFHRNVNGGIANEMTPEELAERDKQRAIRRAEGIAQRQALTVAHREKVRQLAATAEIYDGAAALTPAIPESAVRMPSTLYQEDGGLDIKSREVPDYLARGQSTPLGIRLCSPQFLNEEDQDSVRRALDSFMTDVVRLNFMIAQRFDFFHMDPALLGTSSEARMIVRGVLKEVEAAHDRLLEGMEFFKQQWPEEKKIARPDTERRTNSEAEAEQAIERARKEARKTVATEKSMAAASKKRVNALRTTFRKCVMEMVKRGYCTSAEAKPLRDILLLRARRIGNAKTSLYNAANRNLTVCAFKDWDPTKTESLKRAKTLMAEIYKERDLRMKALEDEGCRQAVVNLDAQWSIPAQPATESRTEGEPA